MRKSFLALLDFLLVAITKNNAHKCCHIGNIHLTVAVDVSRIVQLCVAQNHAHHESDIAHVHTTVAIHITNILGSKVARLAIFRIINASVFRTFYVIRIVSRTFATY